MFIERKFKHMRPFTLKELCAWWESEGTLALLPKGCNPKKTCNKAHFAITQRAPIEFHKGIRDALVQHCKVEARACFVYEDRVIMRNPTEIKKVMDTLKPLVRIPKRKAQIMAFETFYAAREHLFRSYTPKPTLRKK
jgi:hypothetical protein